MDSFSRRGAGLGEAFAVWALLGLVALAICVTYARVPSGDLYHTSMEGLAGGFGRALVFLNFPAALAAIAVLGVVADRADSLGTDLASLLAVALCAVVAVPGVVEQADLDAKWVNAVPATGVGLAFALTVLTALRYGIGAVRGRVPLDPLRVVCLLVILVVALPWIWAELGFFLDSVPGLGFVMAGETLREHGEPLRAVHLGHHHGLDGALLASVALLVSRQLGAMRRRRLRVAHTAYLSLLLVYGLANLLNDVWLEQLGKRGTTGIEIPSMITPSVSVAWLALLVAAGAVYALFAWTTAPPRRP